MVKNMVVMVLVVVCGLVLASAEPQFGGSGGCRPGTVTQQDCNTCRCLPSGGLACTRKACLGGASGGGGGGRPRPIPLPGNFNGNGRFPPNFGGNFNGNGQFPSNFGGFGNFLRG